MLAPMFTARHRSADSMFWYGRPIPASTICVGNPRRDGLAMWPSRRHICARSQSACDQAQFFPPTRIEGFWLLQRERILKPMRTTCFTTRLGVGRAGANGRGAVRAEIPTAMRKDMSRVLEPRPLQAGVDVTDYRVTGATMRLSHGTAQSSRRAGDGGIPAPITQGRHK